MVNGRTFLSFQKYLSPSGIYFNVEVFGFFSLHFTDWVHLPGVQTDLKRDPKIEGEGEGLSFGCYNTRSVTHNVSSL